jgi:hypothetical protein
MDRFLNFFIIWLWHVIKSTGVVDGSNREIMLYNLSHCSVTIAESVIIESKVLFIY